MRNDEVFHLSDILLDLGCVYVCLTTLKYTWHCTQIMHVYIYHREVAFKDVTIVKYNARALTCNAFYVDRFDVKLNWYRWDSFDSC